MAIVIGKNGVSAVNVGGDFLQTALSGGLVQMWETRRACSTFATRAGSPGRAAEMHALYEREQKELGEEEANRRQCSRAGMQQLSELYGDGKTPLWRVISGLTAGVDWSDLHPNDRAARWTRLIRAVEKVVRFEWRAFEKAEKAEGGRQKAESKSNGNSDDGNGDGSDGIDDPRVRWWDPMRVVCAQFGIAYSMLSRVGREVCGLSASDLTDRVKTETIRTKMRAEVKAWVLEIMAAQTDDAEENEEETLADALWTRVQKKRGQGRWSRVAWAVRYGYSSYTRFQRACLAAFGVSPVELERVVLEEVCAEMGVVAGGNKPEGACGAVLERIDGEVGSKGDEGGLGTEGIGRRG